MVAKIDPSLLAGKVVLASTAPSGASSVEGEAAAGGNGGLGEGAAPSPHQPGAQGGANGGSGAIVGIPSGVRPASRSTSLDMAQMQTIPFLDLQILDQIGEGSYGRVRRRWPLPLSAPL